jgi:hypothetical protein
LVGFHFYVFTYLSETIFINKLPVMKKNFVFIVLSLFFLFSGLVNNCKKDSVNNPHNPPDNCIPDGPPTDIGIKTSFTEEFDSVYALAAKGWVIKDNSGCSAQWSDGSFGFDNKMGVWHGFSAFSYTSWKSEYAYSQVTTSSTSPVTISSWLITPVLSVKNGDRISFYTRSDTISSYIERMQVLMNKSSSASVGTLTSSVCSFTTVLFDINQGQAVGGYPTTWTKYEYTFSGITGKTDTRIGFRHYVVGTSNISNAKGTGIDLFKFEVN